MRLISTAFALWAAALAPAAAETLPEVVSEVTLIEGWRQPDGSRLAAVEIRLAPGWHTYWRVPGDAGIPPDFDWSRSRNLATVAYEWPRPDVFTSYGLQSLGYAERVVLPVRLTPQDPDAPIEVALDLDFGVCADICRPDRVEIAARIEPDAPARGRSAIEAALAERAWSAAEAGIAGVTCTLAPAGKGYEVTTEVTFAAAPDRDQIAVLETGQPDLWIGMPVSRTDGSTVVARAPIQAAGGGGPALERRALRVTVLDAGRAVDIHGCEAPD